MKNLILIILILANFTLFAQDKEQIDNSIVYANELLSENTSKSFDILVASIEESKHIGYKKGEADGYYHLSEFYRITRKSDECIENLYLALELYEEIQDKKGMADVYNDIALSYDEFGLEGDFIDYYFKSLHINKSINNFEDMVVNYMNISSYYESLEDYDKSMAYLDTSITIAESIGDSILIGHTYNSKGYSYDLNGDYEKALINYKKALKTFKSQGDKYLQIAPLINIASVHLKKGDNETLAIDLLDEASKLSIDLEDDLYASITFNFLQSIYASNNDFANAYKYHKLYKTYSDSLNDNESEKRFVELNMQHEFDIEKEQILMEQEKKNLAHKEDVKRSAIVKNSFIVGSILLLIIAIVSFKAFRNKKKTGEEIAEKNKEITDSINYAKMLQTAILSPSNKADDELKDLFVLFQPKDIVSGDFYWVEKNEIDDSVMFAAIDCTGHGVPGAMLSIVGHNALENIIHNQHITKPSIILEKLNDAVCSKLKANGSREMHDGMDVAFCRLDRERNVLEFSGANNPVYIVRSGEVIIHKGTKKAIGQEPGTCFIHNEIFLQKGDSVYVFSDGYSDQFGGEKGKKMGSKEFKRFLTTIQGYDMDTQRDILKQNIKEWMEISDCEQIDDICVIGMKI